MKEKDFVIGELKMLSELPIIPDEAKVTLKKAAALLADPEPVVPNLVDGEYYCPECGQCIGEADDAGIANYCFSCGKPIKW